MPNKEPDSLEALDAYFNAIARPLIQAKVDKLFLKMEKSLRVALRPKPWYMTEKRWKRKASRHVRLQFLLPSLTKDHPDAKEVNL